MRLQRALVVSAGLLLAAPVSGLASGKRPAEMAQAAGTAAGSRAAQQGDKSGDAEMSFEDRVADFITEFYLSSERRTEEDLERLYAVRVDYFGKGRWSRARVIGDKRSYYARWQRRSYTLLRETLRVDPRPGADKVFDITFEYTFDVGSSSRVSRGLGRALLTMDLSQDGGRITRETGDVIERW
jgi:hypothetical protein